MFSPALQLLNNTKGLKALDIGCATGVVTNARFSKFSNFKKVIGIDSCSEAIERARQRYGNEMFFFEEMNVESIDFENQITELMNNNEINFIFSSLTLHHLQNPEKLLRILRKKLPSGSVIVLRGSDDNSILTYPDDGLMEDIIKMTMELEGVSDRFNGRKLYTQLFKSGYTSIELFYDVKDTSNMSYDERYQVYQETLWRKSYFLEKKNSNPDNEKFAENYNWICQALDLLEEKILEPGFFYSVTDFGALAMKP